MDDEKAKADALLKSIRETLEELEKDDAVKAATAKPTSGTKMKMTELDGPDDPTRKVPVAVYGLPSEATVWVQRDPLKGMHHITLDYKGGQWTTSVTDQVLAQATDMAAIQEAIVQDLLAQANEETDTAKYKAIKLSYWKWLINETVSKHYQNTEKQARRVYISQEVFEYIVDSEDDLPRASTRSGHKKVDFIIPEGMDWRSRRPAEGDLKRFIRVE